MLPQRAGHCMASASQLLHTSCSKGLGNTARHALACCLPLAFRESDDTAAERPQQACSHSTAAPALPEEAQKGQARSWWS